MAEEEINLDGFAAPKTDQLNVDNFVGDEEKIIKITKVVTYLDKGRKKYYLNYEGDEGRPYKPCVTMQRGIMELWGKKGSVFVGRHIALYIQRDVVYAGEEVGGIRVSGMSDIPEDTTILVTISNKKKKKHTIRKLIIKDEQEEKALAWVKSIIPEIEACVSIEAVNELKKKNEKALTAIKKHKTALDLLDKAFKSIEEKLNGDEKK